MQRSIHHLIYLYIILSLVCLIKQAICPCVCFYKIPLKLSEYVATHNVWDYFSSSQIGWVLGNLRQIWAWSSRKRWYKITSAKIHFDTKPDIRLSVSHDKCSNNIVVALTFKFKSCFRSSVQLVTHQRDFNVELGSSVNLFYLDSSSIFYLW